MKFSQIHPANYIALCIVVYATIELGVGRRLRQQNNPTESSDMLHSEREADGEKMRWDRRQIKVNSAKRNDTWPVKIGAYSVLHMLLFIALIIFFLWILYGSFKR